MIFCYFASSKVVTSIIKSLHFVSGLSVTSPTRAETATFPRAAWFLGLGREAPLGFGREAAGKTQHHEHHTTRSAQTQRREK